MTMIERPIEIDAEKFVYGVTFSANGTYLVSGELGEVQVWQVEDGKWRAKLPISTGRGTSCLAVSTNGKWIAAGTYGGQVSVWDVDTRNEILSSYEENLPPAAIHAIDFSPDSSRLVAASSTGVASFWDVTTCQRVSQFRYHGQVIVGAKYSPSGDRIAIATWKDRVRVYDSKNHYLLVDLEIKVGPLFNSGVLWSNNLHLLVISDGKIKRFEASTGSMVSEWPIPDADCRLSCIALPKHGKFVTYSSGRTVTFWDTSTCTQLSVIQHAQDIRSIALSPDDMYLAIGGGNGKIFIDRLAHINSHLAC